MIPNIKEVVAKTVLKAKERSTITHLLERIKYKIDMQSSVGEYQTSLFTFFTKPSDVLKVKKDLTKAGYSVTLPKLTHWNNGPEGSLKRYYSEIKVSWWSKDKGAV